MDVPEAPVPLFTLAQAREVLAELRPVLDAVVVVRADAAELAAAVRLQRASPRGGLPELKAAQAQLDELLTQVQHTGAVLRGFAPLLLDFAGELDGEPVQVCWLEGEPGLGWYHAAGLGFAGRRRLP